MYPGTVLFEGTNVSEGRGTTRPFELIGAPWIVAERFAEAMNRGGLPGALFRPAVFEPTFHKHARQACGGCQIHVVDRRTFRPVETAVALLAAFRAGGPDRFAWRDPPYEYEHERRPIDVLAGSPQLREQIESPGLPRARSRDPGSRRWRVARLRRGVSALLSVMSVADGRADSVKATNGPNRWLAAMLVMNKSGTLVWKRSSSRDTRRAPRAARMLPSQERHPIDPRRVRSPG